MTLPDLVQMEDRVGRVGAEGGVADAEGVEVAVEGEDGGVGGLVGPVDLLLLEAGVLEPLGAHEDGGDAGGEGGEGLGELGAPHGPLVVVGGGGVDGLDGALAPGAGPALVVQLEVVEDLPAGEVLAGAVDGVSELDHLGVAEGGVEDLFAQAICIAVEVLGVEAGAAEAGGAGDPGVVGELLGDDGLVGVAPVDKVVEGLHEAPAAGLVVADVHEVGAVGAGSRRSGTPRA
jgi:hypothetical protein